MLHRKVAFLHPMHPPVQGYSNFLLNAEGWPWDILSKPGYEDWDSILARKTYDGNWWRIHLPALRLIYQDSLRVLNLPSPGFSWDSDGFAFIAMRSAGQHFRFALYMKSFLERVTPETLAIHPNVPRKTQDLITYLGMRNGIEVVSL